MTGALDLAGENQRLGAANVRLREVIARQDAELEVARSQNAGLRSQVESLLARAAESKSAHSGAVGPGG